MLFNNDKRPPPGSAAAVKYDAYEALDDEGKQFIDQLAYEVAVLFDEEGLEKAKRHMNDALRDCDDEWRLALWWKLNSRIRTAFRK